MIYNEIVEFLGDQIHHGIFSSGVSSQMSEKGALSRQPSVSERY